VEKVEKVEKASNEGELFDFLLCNYLLLRCGKLGDEQKIMLDALNISWVEHVEKEMGLNKNNGLLFKVLLATHKFISAKVTLTYSSDTANQPKNSLLRIQPLD
jgi:hypothetical protein